MQNLQIMKISSVCMCVGVTGIETDNVVLLEVKNPLSSAGDLRDTGLIPESGRSPGGGHGNPL